MIRIAALGSAALLGLSACNAPEPTPPASVPPVSQAPAPAATNLTSAGYGPLRIGMTRAEIVTAMGEDANPAAVGGPDPESCDMFRPSRAPEGLLVMVEDGMLTSIHLGRNTTVQTDRGLAIGDTAVAVKQVYGTAAEVSPHKYVDAPAEYITVWTTTDHDGASARGLRYEIGDDGRVQSIAAGGSSIQYVEGCA